MNESVCMRKKIKKLRWDEDESKRDEKIIEGY